MNQFNPQAKPITASEQPPQKLKPINDTPDPEETGTGTGEPESKATAQNTSSTEKTQEEMSGSGSAYQSPALADMPGAAVPVQNIFANSPPLNAYRGDIWSSVKEKSALQKTLQAIGRGTSTISEHMGSIVVGTMCASAILYAFYWSLLDYHVKHPYDQPPPFPPTLPETPPFLSFLRNTANLGEVLQLLPYAVLASLIAMGVAALAIYHTRARGISCDDRNLILEGSGPIMIGVKWKAIKEIEQSRTWDIFNGKRDLLTVRTLGGETFKLRVTDITSKQDIGTFFNRVRTCAPQAVLKIAAEIRHAEPSYTELWLKYFSAPSERNNKGLLEPGMTVDSGRYRVIETVGGGGQGTAYLASCQKMPSNESADAVHFVKQPQVAQPELGSEIVLKEYVLPVHRGQATAEKTADKLKGEAEILSRLDHPQIVKLLDGFIEDYRGYLVLEYVQGESLKTLVERLGPQPEKQVIRWALQIADILAYLHSLTPPVVHRDMTPDNIILQQTGLVKVVDFNVAHQVDSSATATVVGKHAYIPPEQFRGKPTEQSDIYALGGTLFYLLTATEPEPISVARPARHGAGVSEALDAIVAKATALDPAKRYLTVGAFRSDLLALE